MPSSQNQHITLSELMRRLEEKKFPYIAREGDLRRLQAWASCGDFDMAIVAAEGIAKRQAALRDAKKNGLPEDLMLLLAQLAKERFDYPRRGTDVNGVRSWIARGDFDMGRSFATTIIKRQQNLREAASNGLPEPLQSRLQQLSIDVLHYAGRSSDISAMNAWIESGDFAMGITCADAILKRQSALRSAGATNPSPRRHPN